MTPFNPRFHLEDDHHLEPAENRCGMCTFLAWIVVAAVFVGYLAWRLG